MQEFVVDVLDGLLVGSAAGACLAAVLTRPRNLAVGLGLALLPRLLAFGVLAYLCLDEARFAGADTVLAGAGAFAFWLCVLRGWWLPARAAPATPRTLAPGDTAARMAKRRLMPEPAAVSADRSGSGVPLASEGERVTVVPATIGYDEDDASGGSPGSSRNVNRVLRREDLPNAPSRETDATLIGTTSLSLPPDGAGGGSAPAVVVNVETRRRADCASYFVLLAWPDGTTRRIGGFASAAAAAAWIEQDAPAWITRRPQSYIRLAPIEAAVAVPRAGARDPDDAARPAPARRDRRAGPV
jgi:hypothetical protein